MDWWNAPTFIRQFGGRIFSTDGTRCIVDSAESIAGIQLMHDLTYKYGVMPSAAEEAAMATQGGWGSGTITLFSGGKAAMAIGGRWWLCTLRDNKNLRLGAVEWGGWKSLETMLRYLADVDVKDSVSAMDQAAKKLAAS